MNTINSNGPGFLQDLFNAAGDIFFGNGGTLASRAGGSLGGGEILTQMGKAHQVTQAARKHFPEINKAKKEFNKIISDNPTVDFDGEDIPNNLRMAYSDAAVKVHGLRSKFKDEAGDGPSSAFQDDNYDGSFTHKVGAAISDTVNQVKRYNQFMNAGTERQQAIKKTLTYGTMAGTYMGAMTGARYLDGGTFTRNSDGESDWAGLPL